MMRRQMPPPAARSAGRENPPYTDANGLRP